MIYIGRYDNFKYKKMYSNKKFVRLVNTIGKKNPDNSNKKNESGKIEITKFINNNYKESLICPFSKTQIQKLLVHKKVNKIKITYNIEILIEAIYKLCKKNKITHCEIYDQSSKKNVLTKDQVTYIILDSIADCLYEKCHDNKITSDDFTKLNWNLDLCQRIVKIKFNICNPCRRLKLKRGKKYA